MQCIILLVMLTMLVFYTVKYDRLITKSKKHHL
jgi:hypothetical protein